VAGTQQLLFILVVSNFKLPVELYPGCMRLTGGSTSISVSISTSIPINIGISIITSISI
jgi:hypothetical protein